MQCEAIRPCTAVDKIIFHTWSSCSSSLIIFVSHVHVFLSTFCQFHAAVFLQPDSAHMMQFPGNSVWWDRKISTTAPHFHRPKVPNTSLIRVTMNLRTDYPGQNTGASSGILYLMATPLFRTQMHSFLSLSISQNLRFHFEFQVWLNKENHIEDWRWLVSGAAAEECTNWVYESRTIGDRRSYIGIIEGRAIFPLLTAVIAPNRRESAQRSGKATIDSAWKWKTM